MDVNIKTDILRVVKQIPPGSVMYYGQIANIVGTYPKIVGFILSDLTEKELQGLPWQRVVAKNGVVSSLKLGYKGQLQVELLEKEGFKVIDGKIIDADRYLYKGE